VLQLPTSQNNHQLIRTFNDARLDQLLRRDINPFLENSEPLQVDWRELDAPWIAEAYTPRERELPHEWQLSTLKVWTHATAAASFLALRAAPSRLALPSSNAPSNTLTSLHRSFSGSQFMQFHSTPPLPN
jgi:hypothetical protein